MRLDQYVSSKLQISRQKARSMIIEGEILINGRTVFKPSFKVSSDHEIIIRALPRYVGRGGLKLERALTAFEIDPSGLVCLDVGASTGGFTDCLLRFGASRVFAIENGTGQLDPSLASDDRVVSLEKTDIRSQSLKEMIQPADFACVDVSFISIKKVLPSVLLLLKPGAGIVVLVKPQFEAGPENVSKKGIVRDPKAHIKVLEDVLMHVKALGITCSGLTFSPVTGGEGNIEYLIHLRKALPEAQVLPSAAEIVRKAFSNLRS
jgi:23S rRNA (cytidine1920-2'-O)/16S rRNA (cytidine1409-2'-O)-methyltransferase